MATPRSTPEESGAADRIPQPDGPVVPDELTAVQGRREELRAKHGRGLRDHAARGTMTNTLFMIGLSVLGLVRGFLLAHFLTRADYGVWGILAVSLGTLLWLKSVGIGDKYIQQDDPDQ